MKIIENTRTSMKLDDIGLARPGSIMLHFGFSRRFMGADLGRPGSIMVHFGFSRRSMGFDLVRPGLIIVHFGISRCVEKIGLA